jgi:HAMP domain-containing protein
MTLRLRLLLLVGALLVGTVAATALTLTAVARRTLIQETQDDARTIAGLVAKSAAFARQVPAEGEAAIAEQMVVEATILAQYVAVAEAAGQTPAEINAWLATLTATTPLDEVWITDATGHAYLRSDPTIDFTFSPDPEVQPQASAFWPLLTGEQTVVIQALEPRTEDGEVYKYVGVGGVDGPRIVQVGYRAETLQALARRVGPPQLVQDLLVEQDLLGVRIVDDALVTLAAGDRDGEAIASAQTVEWLVAAIVTGETASYRHDGVVDLIAPVRDAGGQVAGAVQLTFSAAEVAALERRQVQLAALVAAAVLVAGLLATSLLARRIAGPVAALTAATAGVGEGTFSAEALAPVARRRDELGELARRFAWMAERVIAREAGLRRQVQELTIEIDRVRADRQVAEITETDYFRDLQAQARRLRARPAGGTAG